MNPLSAVGNSGVWGGAAGASVDLAVDSVTQTALHTFLQESGDPSAQLGVQVWRVPSLLQPKGDVLRSVGEILANTAAERRQRGEEKRLGLDVDGPSMQAIAVETGGGIGVASVADRPRAKFAEEFHWHNRELDLKESHLGPWLLDLVLALRGEGPHEGLLDSAMKVAGNKSHSVAERVMALRLMEEELHQWREYTFEAYLKAIEFLIDILEDESAAPRLKEMALALLKKADIHPIFIFTANKVLLDNRIPPVSPWIKGSSERFSWSDFKKFEARFRDVARVLSQMLEEELPDPSHFSPDKLGTVGGAWPNILGEFLGLQTEVQGPICFVRALNRAENKDLPVYKRGLALVEALRTAQKLGIRDGMEAVFDVYFVVIVKLKEEGLEELIADAALIMKALCDASRPESGEYPRRLQGTIERFKAILPDQTITEDIERRMRESLVELQLPVPTDEELQRSWDTHLNLARRRAFRNEFRAILNSQNPGARKTLKGVLEWLDHWGTLQDWNWGYFARAVKAMAIALVQDPNFPIEGVVVNGVTLWNNPFERETGFTEEDFSQILSPKVTILIPHRFGREGRAAVG